MVVHPAPGHWSGTFANALAHHVLIQQQPGEAPPLPPPALASPPPLADSTSSSLLPDAFGDGLRPGIVHRLDRYTSGVLLGAKTVDAQRNLLQLGDEPLQHERRRRLLLPREMDLQVEAMRSAGIVTVTPPPSGV